MKRFLPSVFFACLFLAPAALGEDWANWRGPQQNGVSLDRDLPDRFSIKADAPNSNLIWKQPYGGRSTPLVLNGRVYIIDDSGEGVNEQERVMCFDADSGKVLWQHKFNVFLTSIVSDRVGWSELAADPETGNIYAHGVQGLIFCFDKDGKVLWSHSATEEYGRISGYGGRVNSPVVDGDLVVIPLVNASWGDQAPPGNRLLALDKRTGVPVWWSPTLPFRGTYYSTPVTAVIHGERLLITGASAGSVDAFRARTGELVWGYQVGARSINSSPVVDGSRVYISHGEENLDTNQQGRVVCLDAGNIKDGKPALVWKRDGIRAGYTSPILHDGKLYVCDDHAALYCLDAGTGKTIWRFKYGVTAKASAVWGDGKIYVAEVASKFHILKPAQESCKKLYTQFFLSPDGNSVVELNGSASVANGKIYFTTRNEIYCIGKKDYQPQSVQVQRATDDDAPAQAQKPAHLQVVPADIVLYPGQSANFKAKAFDAYGRFLREVIATWSLPAPPLPPGAKGNPPPLSGKVSAGGELTVSKMPGQQGVVEAKSDGLTALARVRVVPRLPYFQDFEKIPENRSPPGWINCQGKFAVVQKEHSKVLKKLANNPNILAARAHTFFGLPAWTDYTIQADVLGAKKRNDMPDIGVLANRYTLILDGNKQRLRIASWEDLPRVDKRIDFSWKPDIWYTMKMTVDVQGDKALVRGKVWEHDQAEPRDWTIEFEDPTPNREGSPGLYGYATGILQGEVGAEIFYDNVKVTPNKDVARRVN
jgi:outer membrane protein assembly factor BamB